MLLPARIVRAPLLTFGYYFLMVILDESPKKTIKFSGNTFIPPYPFICKDILSNDDEIAWTTYPKDMSNGYYCKEFYFIDIFAIFSNLLIRLVGIVSTSLLPWNDNFNLGER